jgi:S1-C subfamily serine protease
MMTRRTARNSWSLIGAALLRERGTPMPHQFKGSTMLLICVASLLTAAAACAQDQSLDETLRTNGTEILKAIAPAAAKIEACRVVLGETKDKPIMSGIILSADGYLLTKWEEISTVKAPRAWLPDGSDVEAKVIRHDDKLDLALLKIARQELPAVEWASLPLTWKMGQWLCAPVHDDSSQPRLGVMSALRRAIPTSGAVMGVRFEPSEKGDRGVTIEEVAHEGPAEQAGLKAGDVVIQIKGETVNQTAAVRRIMTKCHPGDLIKVRYLRVGKEADCDVRLGSMHHVFMNWSGGDFANHGTSLRTDNFPDVIQNDLPLTPQDMGGGLFDLQGHAIGINIARVDRVTNYALPAGLFLAEVNQWVQEDRAKKAKNP